MRKVVYKSTTINTGVTSLQCVVEMNYYHKTTGTISITILLQGITFLFQYLGLRGHTQEAFYNIGRAFHQLGD